MKMRIRPSRRRLAGAALAVALLALPGCASGGGAADGAGGSTSRSTRSPITREEIGDRSGLDLYEIVRQLRPSWLQSRGQATPTGGVRQVQVVVDGTLQPGGVGVLRTLRGAQVQELRHLSGQDATTRYGLDVEGGVIVVTTDRGRGEGLWP